MSADQSDLAAEVARLQDENDDLWTIVKAHETANQQAALDTEESTDLHLTWRERFWRWRVGRRERRRKAAFDEDNRG